MKTRGESEKLKKEKNKKTTEEKENKINLI